MNTVIKLALSLLLPAAGIAQTVSGVYKINHLLKRISDPDTIYVVNFWATWCKPCVSELPSFDSLFMKMEKRNVKVILVSLDFKEDLEKKVSPFLKSNHIMSHCVLLDEVNGNNFVDKVSKKWSGAIPATFLKRKNKKKLLEKKLNLKQLTYLISELEKKK